MNFSCKDCENRFPGCHDRCEKYQREKAEHEQRKEQERQARKIKQGLYEQRAKAVARARKANENGKKYF